MKKLLLTILLTLSISRTIGQTIYSAETKNIVGEIIWGEGVRSLHYYSNDNYYPIEWVSGQFHMYNSALGWQPVTFSGTITYNVYANNMLVAKIVGNYLYVNN